MERTAIRAAGRYSFHAAGAGSAFDKVCATLVCVFLASAGLMSCSYVDLSLFGRDDAVGERVAETAGDHVELGLAADADWSFVVSADTHFGSPSEPTDEVKARFAAFLAGRRDAFVAFVGDEVDHGLEEEYSSFAEWAGSLADADGKALRWYAAVGNHDLYNEGWSNFVSAFHETGHGKSYAVLDAGGIQVYFLDTGNAAIGEAQFKLLLDDMAASPATPKIVLSHYALYAGPTLPYYRIASPRERALLVELFADSNVKAFIAGHWHYPVHDSVGEAFEEWLCDSLTYSEDAVPHCLVVTVKGGGISVGRAAF